MAAATKKRAKPDPWKRLQRLKVLVALKSGGAFEGVLWFRCDEYVVLRAAKYIPNTLEEAKKVDGDVVIDLVNVDYWQFSKGTGVR